MICMQDTIRLQFAQFICNSDTKIGTTHTYIALVVS